LTSLAYSDCRGWGGKREIETGGEGEKSEESERSEGSEKVKRVKRVKE
jgi:hypothetical protein